MENVIIWGFCLEEQKFLSRQTVNSFLLDTVVRGYVYSSQFKVTYR